jgi:dipeptidyl aminopeptidase/acylaminoacyl peptidase
MKNALLVAAVLSLPAPLGSLEAISYRLALGAGTAVDTPAGVLTPQQTLDRRTIADLEFSPDGSKLAFTVTEPVKGKARSRSLWLLDVATGGRRQLTFSGKSDGSPRWSPDGSSIAFTSDRSGESAQLYVLSLRGGEAEQLTDTSERVESFRWSPDGTRIALLMRDPRPDGREPRERRADDKNDSRVVDKDGRQLRVWLLDVASKRLRQVTQGRWKVGQIEWLPDGRRLIAVATDRPEADQWVNRIYRFDVEPGGNGAFAQISAPRGPFSSLSVSPDGQTIAYVGARVDGPEPHDLYLQPTSGGAPANLTAATVDRPVSQPHWVDNETLIVHVQRGFRSTLATVGRDGKARLFDDLDVNPTAYACTAGRRPGTISKLAYAGESAIRAPEVYTRTGDAEPGAKTAVTPMTTFNSTWASVPLVTPELVTYRSFDGVEIEAALLRPTNHEQRASTGPLPFVVLVHGGPTGRWSDTFEPWGQLLAARSYAVLYPNVRGSTGYGQKFVEMNRADWGGGDFKDVMAGVDAMIARGVADANRLGIGGWSYGGYMSAWAVTQTTRFKAAVSGAPVIDMASEFGTEDGPAYDEWFYGTPYERLDGFIKSSPMTYVKNVRTPTLLLQGEADLTDPLGQSLQFYRGLKRYNVESDLVLYPREPHGLREEPHLLDRLNRIIGWFDKYLKGGPAEPSAMSH